MLKSLLLGLALAASLATSAGAAVYSPAGGDFVLRDFRFQSGERLAELKMHYSTLGKPHRNASGQIDNAVLLLHGTGGDGLSFMRPRFADGMFGAGQPLDLAFYYIIMVDSIGHGKSSKPSDGMHMRFPKYDYFDMAQAEHRLVVQHLGINKLRLVFGTSMGCMHAFIWAETWPDAADGYMPMACLPTQIAGRNRIWRKLSIEAIRNDPTWHDGDYTSPPLGGMRTAAALNFLAGSAPHQDQKQWPTRDAADAYALSMEQRLTMGADANDTIYALDSSRTYNPEADLEKITAPVLWINSADDFINPPELQIAERLVPRIRYGRFVLLPISPLTHGHGTHSYAEAWSGLMVEFLKQTAPKP